MVAGTTYQMLEVIKFCFRERALSLCINNRTNLLGEKKENEAFRGDFFCWKTGEKTSR